VEKRPSPDSRTGTRGFSPGSRTACNPLKREREKNSAGCVRGALYILSRFHKTRHQNGPGQSCRDIYDSESHPVARHTRTRTRTHTHTHKHTHAHAHAHTRDSRAWCGDRTTVTRTRRGVVSYARTRRRRATTYTLSVSSVSVDCRRATPRRLRRAPPARTIDPRSPAGARGSRETTASCTITFFVAHTAGRRAADGDDILIAPPRRPAGRGSTYVGLLCSTSPLSGGAGTGGVATTPPVHACAAYGKSALIHSSIHH
jgi:hypothetical protein